MYSTTSVLLREVPTVDNPWNIRLFTMFHMSGASDLFRDRDELEQDGWVLAGNRYSRAGEMCLPLYEGKMLMHFDHRFSEVSQGRSGQQLRGSSEHTDRERYSDPNYVPLPRYWISEPLIPSDLEARGWLLGYRRVAGSVANARTATFAVLPRVAVSDSIFLIDTESAETACLLTGNFNSFVLDYALRNKISGINLSFYFIKQLPVVIPANYSQETRIFVKHRVLELTYTAWDLQPFARDCGYDGPPFRWDEERRFLLRCELDAAYFHLYGIARDDVDYIMETFPIVKRKDVASHGEYRTKRVILEIYDAMQRAMDSGEPYQTRLDPPPADPRAAHASASPEWVE